MSLELYVLDDTGNTKTSVSVRRVEAVHELAGDMDHAEAILSRADWETVDGELDRRVDTLLVERPDDTTLFHGRFDRDRRGDGEVTVEIQGFERDAQDAEPTGENVVYQNVDDSGIVADLIDSVPTLTTGQIDTLSNNLSTSFSYANPSKALRDVAEATAAEVRYNFDQSVDYLAPDSIGEDKTQIELSPSAQSIVGDIDIEEDVREEVTHIRGFGAQSGPDQITATAAIDSFDGGRQIWREYENKDIKEESRLQSVINELVEEYDGEPRYLKIELQTANTDIELGDTVSVSIPSENINEELRVITRRELFTATGATLGLVLSNRLWTIRDDNRENRKDLQRFNRGYQGFVDRAQVTSGWDPAGDGVVQTLEIVDWPDDIVEEHNVTLAVQGRAWRSPITDEGHDHPFDATHAHDTIGHVHDIDTTSTERGLDTDRVYGGRQSANLDEGEDITIQVTVPSLTEDVVTVFAWANASNNSDFTTGASISITELVSGSVLFDDNGKSYASGETSAVMGSMSALDGSLFPTTDLAGRDITFQLVNDNTDRDWAFEVGIIAMSSHTHDIDDITESGSEVIEEEIISETTDAESALVPEIVDTFDGQTYYPTDVEIRVNGSTVDTIAGDTVDWTETIDLSSELSPGLNTISADPNTRGELNLILASELFRRGRSD